MNWLIFYNFLDAIYNNTTVLNLENFGKMLRAQKIISRKYRKILT